MDVSEEGFAWLLAPQAARNLLGWSIRAGSPEGVVTVALTEVEAYGGADDPASHAFRGLTRRNRTMFESPGKLYVYRSYGLHWAANVVVGPSGAANAVLLRAGRVVEGKGLAFSRRGSLKGGEVELARGPGNLAAALGVSGENDGDELFGGGLVTLLPPARAYFDAEIESGPRVGVSRGAETPWRFWVRGDKSVSRYRRSPRA